MTHVQCKLNIVTALADEARPIIHHFRLKRLHHIHAYPVYGNHDVQLIVAGMGILAAAAATGYLAGIGSANRYAAWLNVGIAGAKCHGIGDFVLVNKISDQRQQRHFYPTIWFKHGFASAPLISVDAPAATYNDGALRDMEAYGFVSAALRVSTSELVHCCKVISDSCRSDMENITSQTVVDSLEQNIPQIDQLAQYLMQGVNQLNSDVKGGAEADLIKSKFHFTTSQQIQLDLTLQKWFAMSTDSPLKSLDFSAIKNAAQLLRELDIRLSRMTVSY